MGKKDKNDRKNDKGKDDGMKTHKSEMRVKINATFEELIQLTIPEKKEDDGDEKKGKK